MILKTGDIKSGNILLDKHMEPKIGDFGLARKGPCLNDKTHITLTRISGTPSYLPDDYLRTRNLTYAVDTYSFGMVLFELVTCKLPSWQNAKHMTLKTFIREV